MKNLKVKARGNLYSVGTEKVVPLSEISHHVPCS